MKRDAIEDFLNPLNGYRGQLAHQGKEVKDHRVLNREMLRKKTEEVKKRQEAEKE
jgi:hypothetical protein